MICQYCGAKLFKVLCTNPACPGRLRKEEDVYMGRACPPNCPGNIDTLAPAEVERLVDDLLSVSKQLGQSEAKGYHKYSRLQWPVRGCPVGAAVGGGYGYKNQVQFF